MGEIRVLVDRYKVTDGTNSIYLVINRDRMIITPGDRAGENSFTFCPSKKEVVRSIANLMLKAVEVVENWEVEVKNVLG